MALNIHNCGAWLQRLPDTEEIPVRVGGGWDFYSVTVKVIVGEEAEYYATYVRAKKGRDNFKPGQHTTRGYGHTTGEAEGNALSRAARLYGLGLPLPALTTQTAQGGK